MTSTLSCYYCTVQVLLELCNLSALCGVHILGVMLYSCEWECNPHLSKTYVKSELSTFQRFGLAGFHCIMAMMASFSLSLSRRHTTLCSVAWVLRLALSLSRRFLSCSCLCSAVSVAWRALSLSLLRRRRSSLLCCNSGGLVEEELAVSMLLSVVSL